MGDAYSKTWRLIVLCRHDRRQHGQIISERSECENPDSALRRPELTIAVKTDSLWDRNLHAAGIDYLWEKHIDRR